MSLCRSIALAAVMVLTSRAVLNGGSASGPLYQAQKRVTDAESQLHKAKVAVKRAADNIRKQIEQTPEYKRAAAAAHAAQAKYNDAVKAARKSLSQSPEYQQAARERDLRQRERDELHGKTDATTDQTTQAALALLKAQQDVAHIEQHAIEADPAATQAQEDLAQANAKLAEIQSTFPQYAQKDAAYQSAQQQVTQATSAVTDAQKQLQQARQQEADAERQRDEQQIRNAQQYLMRGAGIR